MLTRRVNFYMSALVITVVGAFAALFIVHTALSADSYYADAYAVPID